MLRGAYTAPKSSLSSSEIVSQETLFGVSVTTDEVRGLKQIHSQFEQSFQAVFACARTGDDAHNSIPQDT